MKPEQSEDETIAKMMAVIENSRGRAVDPPIFPPLQRDEHMTIADRIVEAVAITFVLVATLGVFFYVGWMIGSIINSVVSW